MLGKPSRTPAGTLQKTRGDRRRLAKTFELGDLVLVHKRVLTSAEDGPAAKLTPVWRGPFEIVEVPSEVNVKVKLGSHRSAPTKRVTVNLAFCPCCGC
jgi:hypothetical protein